MWVTVFSSSEGSMQHLNYTQLPAQGQRGTWQEDHLPCWCIHNVLKTPATRAGRRCSAAHPKCYAEAGTRTALSPCASWCATPEHSCGAVPTALFLFQAQMCLALPSRLTINHRPGICDFPTAHPSNFVIFSSLCIKEMYACISSIRKNASLH